MRIKSLGSLDRNAQSRWFKNKAKTIASKLTEKMSAPAKKNDKDIEKRGKSLGGRLNDMQNKVAKDKVPKKDTTEHTTDTVRDKNTNGWGVRRTIKR